MTDPRSLSRQELEAAYGERVAQTGMTQNKAWAAAGGGGLGAALAEVLVLLVPKLEPAEAALSVILATLLGAAAAYYSPRNTLKG